MDIRTIALFSGLLLCVNAHSQPSAPEAAATVVQINSGGYWETESARGRYRAIIQNRGFEHVSSQLWVEWVAEPKQSEPSRIVASVLVEEISGGMWSLSIESLGHSSAGGRLSVNGTNVYTLQQEEYLINLGEPSTYSVFQVVQMQEGGMGSTRDVTPNAPHSVK